MPNNSQKRNLSENSGCWTKPRLMMELEKKDGDDDIIFSLLDYGTH